MERQDRRRRTGTRQGHSLRFLLVGAQKKCSFPLQSLPAASVSLWVVLRPALGQVTLHKFASPFPRPACGCSKTTRRSLPSFPAPSQPLSKNPFVIFPITEETSSENNAGPFPELKTSSFAGLGWARAGHFTLQCAALPQIHMEFPRRWLSPFSLVPEPRLSPSTAKLLSSHSFFLFFLKISFSLLGKLWPCVWPVRNKLGG